MLEHPACAAHLSIDPVADPAEVLPELLPAVVVLDDVQAKVVVTETRRSRDRRVAQKSPETSTLRVGDRRTRR